MIKLCFIDVETTGVEPKENAIIQIAGSIDFLGDKMEEKESFNFKVRPFEGDIITDKALEINKTTREEIARYNKPIAVHSDLVEIFSRHCNKFDKQDKMFFVGYNARFDYDFLRKFFEKCDDNYFGSFIFFPPLDVMNIAIWNSIKARRLLPDFKLQTIVNHLKVDDAVGDYHDAMKDIKVTKNIFLKYYQKELITERMYEFLDFIFEDHSDVLNEDATRTIKALLMEHEDGR